MKVWIGRLSRRMRTRGYKRLLVVGATALLAVGVSTTVIASPAMAGCARYYEFDSNQAQVDNCPGDGADSWAWVYNRLGYPLDLNVQFYDGSTSTIEARYAGNGNAQSYWGRGDIWRVQLCYVYWGQYRCSGWS